MISLKENNARLRVHSLTPDVALLVWDDRAGDAGARRPRVTIDGRPIKPPCSRLRVRLRSTNGPLQERNIIVLRMAARQERVCIRQADGSAIAVAHAIADGDDGPPIPLADLLEGVEAEGRLRILRLMFEIVPDIFRLSDNPAFAAACRCLAAALAPMPPALIPCARLFGSYRLYAGTANAALGPKLNAVVITSARLAKAPFAPALGEDEGEASRLWLTIRDADDAVVVVFSDHGMICRRITASDRHVPAVIEWLGGSGSPKAGARRYVLDCLAHLGRRHVQAAALARELRAMLPPARSRIALPVAAGAEFIAASRAGVFVKGWLADPYGLVEAILIERPGSKRRIDIRSLIRFPRRNVSKPDAAENGAENRSPVTYTLDGFAFFSAHDTPGNGEEPSRISLSLCLQSGSIFAFAEGPSMMRLGAARDAVLGAIPPLYLTRKTIAEWIEPSVVAFHEDDQKAAAGPCQVIDIGCVPNSPEVAVISLVPDDPLLMRYRAGLIAANPEMRSIDMLYILDRAEDRQNVEHFLRDLHAAYGVAARLVVLPRAGTAVAAFNAGARVSCAALLVWLGATVLPERPSWVTQLIGHLRRDANIGIVGTRLMREDQALWNDGLDIGDDHEVWDIRPVRAGFPPGFAPFQPVRRVAGISPGCTAVRQSILESCGGLSQHYLSLDYSLADLCLAAAALGFKTCLTSEPTLFRLGPPGNERQGSAVLDPEREIDRRLLERRWRPWPEQMHDPCSRHSREGAWQPGAASADARAA
jgi:hypothetical protein